MNANEIFTCSKTGRKYRWFAKWDDNGKFMQAKTLRRYSMYKQWI